MTDLHKIIEKQRDYIGQLTKLHSRFSLKEEKTKGYLTSILQEIDDLNLHFKENHEKVVNMVRETSMNVLEVPYIQEECFYTFSDLFLRFKGEILDALPERAMSSPAYASTFAIPSAHADTSASIDAKLPKISLPKFSGEYMEWIPFQDIYMNLVHNNMYLSKVQKFYYLKGTLSGEAANLIKTISATEANYDLAWSTLKSRYHNERVIVDALVRRILNIPQSDGSFQSIKTLLDTTQECIGSLGNLGFDTSSWNPLLIPIIGQKLDLSTRKEWEHSLKSSTSVPSLVEMFNFLERTFRTLESLHEDSPSLNMNHRIQRETPSKSRKTVFHTNQVTQRQPVSCSLCKKQHILSKCYKFIAFPSNSKEEFVNNSGICRNCLASGHHHDNCPSTYRCNICKQLHHTILHRDNLDGSVSSYNSGAIPGNDANASSMNPQISSNNVNLFSNVILSTIRLMLNSENGKFPFPALLDPGSQGTLVSERTVQLLRLNRHKSNCIVQGVGESIVDNCKSWVVLDLWSMRDKPIISCAALVLRKLTNYTPNVLPSQFSIPQGLVESLADPQFDHCDQIDIILGSDILSSIIIPGNSFKLENFFFQNTLFGWVFSGPTQKHPHPTVLVHTVNLDQTLRLFWEQEEVEVKRELTEEELSCEQYFVNTTKRDSDGRYIVNLPFKSVISGLSCIDLDNNHINAYKRFIQLEQRFASQPLFCKRYKDFMREYEVLGHMRNMGSYPAKVQSNSYFLPHHGVSKEESTTTKLRVVFDASSHMAGKASLNESLCAGPALQNDLSQIITRWRRHKIGFCADIEKMFRQIKVCQNHRRFQQILWRYSPSDEISVFELNTVTYGTTPAPYLSIRVLQKLSEDHSVSFPLESRILTRDSYVDDIISGSHSLDDAISIQKNLCKMLSSGGFNLRKWITNSPELLQQIPNECRENSVSLEFDRDNAVKTLGIQWIPISDTFSFKVNIPITNKVTKRIILSESAKLFDPLGWLAPSTIIAKILFQKLWLEGLDWDSEVPEYIKSTWLRYKMTLKCLEKIKISRWLNYNPMSLVELHCFCDASTDAYAAVVYIKVCCSDNIYVNILQAKTKVSPVKTVTIPRLELCAAVLLVKLAQKVKGSLSDIAIENVIYWTDSTTVLSWIRKHPSRWSVYISNRVADIQRHTNTQQWRYVPSAYNPADAASRGIFPEDLVKNQMWWHGPEFLKGPPAGWPKNICNVETLLEERKSKIVSHVCRELTYPDILAKFSSLNKLLRICSLCLRFCNNCKKNKFKIVGVITTRETQNALFSLIKQTQLIDFHIELKSINSGLPVKNKHVLKLMPFVDNAGILRVGGRLQNSNLAFSLKHPILLGKTNPLSILIILDSHQKTLHGGLSLTMSYVNRNFWIISGNQIAKKILSNCVRCFRYSAKTSQQIMGNLPSVRVNMTRPFKHSGVDFAGPIVLKNSTLRSAVLSKGYICVFICMVTKAIHLEAVSDLCTNGFLAAFRRFVSRRGGCTDMYSDCGTNFVGASKELQVLYQRSQKSLPDELRDNLSYIGTNWHFIPPASPHFGGLWEAGVKSVKYHLKRIMTDRVLSYEELSTLLCQVEGCLNSRPLCPLSSDPTDSDALTPAHFLIGEPTVCVQDESLLNVNAQHLSRWKALEQMKQLFWKRWCSEYLNRLQSRPKWLNNQRNFKASS